MTLSKPGVSVNYSSPAGFCSRFRRQYKFKALIW